MLEDEILQYIEDSKEEAYQLLLTLARIPAPSNHEEERAAFCFRWLEEQGAKGVRMDQAQNVIYPVDVREDGAVEVFMAHMDVVFPDKTELPLKVDRDRIYCPGAGDDTACLVCLLMAAKFIAGHIGTPEWRKLRGPEAPGLLLVCNTGEEGLGNLRGVRSICAAYGRRMENFCTFDSTLDKITSKAVGSKRFKVTVRTRGGHSFNDFGQDNAIAKLAGIVERLYQVQVPEDARTTYNVGMISGGTSVNTIAQQAEMLYEFRSERKENLDYMERQFLSALRLAEEGETRIEYEVIGVRPCEGDVDPVRKRALLDRAVEVVSCVTGREPACKSGSTDCNIPLSMGIPSVCVGCFRGGGAHTREEYVEIDSLKEGYRTAFGMILGLKVIRGDGRS